MSDKWKRDIYVTEHRLPTSAEMREAMQARLDAGLPLGAFHNPLPVKRAYVICAGCPDPSNCRDARQCQELPAGGLACDTSF